MREKQRETGSRIFLANVGLQHPVRQCLKPLEQRHSDQERITARQARRSAIPEAPKPGTSQPPGSGWLPIALSTTIFGAVGASSAIGVESRLSRSTRQCEAGTRPDRGEQSCGISVKCWIVARIASQRSRPALNARGGGVGAYTR